MKKIQEIVAFTHKGHSIGVKIDYRKKEITLVKYDDVNQAQQFIFKNRGVEYVADWHNILDAMGYAMDEAKKMLEEEIEEEIDALADRIIVSAKL